MWLDLVKLTCNHAAVLGDIEKRLLLLLCEHLLAVWSENLVVSGCRLWMMVNRDWLRRCQVLRSIGRLTSLRMQTERLGHVRRSSLEVRLRIRRCLITLLLLGLLLSELKSLFKDLHHLIALLLLIDQLLVEDLVHVGNRLLNLVQHLLQLALQLRHDLSRHSLLKLVMNDLTNLLITQI